MLFKNSFDNLTDEEIEKLNEYFDGYDYESSGHTYLAHYIWRNTHDISWEEIDGYLYISALSDLTPEDKKYTVSFPLTRTGTYEIDSLKKSLETARKRFEAEGQEFEMVLIPKSLVTYLPLIYGDSVEISHDREDDDYIYLRSDLEKLSGRKYHQKKNHLNFFLSHYDYAYEEISEKNIKEVWKYVQSKNEFKMTETPDEWKEILELENVAVHELLKLIEEGKDKNILSGAIRMDGKIVAVTIGEYANTKKRDTVLVHVEKADDRIRGLYQAINNEFVKRLPESVIYVNREEDMGMENLRQTKESYRPVKMGEKYSATFKYTLQF